VKADVNKVASICSEMSLSLVPSNVFGSISYVVEICPVYPSACGTKVTVAFLVAFVWSPDWTTLKLAPTVAAFAFTVSCVCFPSFNVNVISELAISWGFPL